MITKKNVPKRADPSTIFEEISIPEHLIPTDPRFGIGPSLIPMEHIKKLYDQGPHYLGTGHRGPPLKDIIKEVREQIVHYFALPNDYTVLLGNGGATFLFDMIGLGLVRQSSIHYTCGEFSKKWYRAHKNIPWIKAWEVSFDYGMGIDITKKNTDRTDLIACTLNETSTGAMMDQFPHINKNDTLIAIDATSGAGQCPCPVSNVDVFFFSPQKVFASEGGLFICILSPKAKKRAFEIADDPHRYIPDIMNWKTCLENSEKNQTYTTPSLSTLFFLNEQFKRLIAFGGYKKVQQDARKKAAHIYGWANEKDYLRPYIREEKHRSLSTCTIDVDDKYPIKPIIKFLKDKHLAYNIDPYRKLQRNQFRIGIFHNISLDNLKRLTRLISLLIERLK